MAAVVDTLGNWSGLKILQNKNQRGWLLARVGGLSGYGLDVLQGEVNSVAPVVWWLTSNTAKVEVPSLILRTWSIYLSNGTNSRECLV